MSRTDAHTPYWVKLHYEGVESHDHRHGDCDYDPELQRPNRFGRNHTTVKCKKYIEYTVVCLHTYRVCESFSYSLPAQESSAIVSPKRHKAYIYDAKNNLVKDDKPLLPVCHEHKSSYSFINMGDGFDRYKEDRYSYFSLNITRRREEAFTIHDGNFARHQFTVAVYDKSIPCSCDDKPARAYPSCEKTTRSGDKIFGYSYYCTCNWCIPPRPSRTAIKQALRNIAKHGYDENLEDDYLDFEDIYHGRDYR